MYVRTYVRTDVRKYVRKEEKTLQSTSSRRGAPRAGAVEQEQAPLDAHVWRCNDWRIRVLLQVVEQWSGEWWWFPLEKRETTIQKKHRDRETQRQLDREKERQRDRETERQRQRQKQRQRQTGRQVETEADRGRQSQRQRQRQREQIQTVILKTDRGRQTEKDVDSDDGSRHMCSLHVCVPWMWPFICLPPLGAPSVYPCLRLWKATN